MKRFAISILATKRKNQGYFVDFTAATVVLVVNAVSKEEAVGKGTLEANKTFPPEAEWLQTKMAIVEIPELNKENKNEQNTSNTD